MHLKRSLDHVAGSLSLLHIDATCNCKGRAASNLNLESPGVYVPRSSICFQLKRPGYRKDLDVYSMFS